MNSPSDASWGRIRLEAFDHQFASSSIPQPTVATPGLLFPPPETTPIVRVVAVDGVAVPENPLGVFTPADISINKFEEVTIDIEARNIPLGTVVQLTMFSETKGEVEFDSEPLAGTFENSTATATVTIPPGFSRFTVKADWGQ